MPRYYVDLQRGSQLTKDTKGFDAEDDFAAKAHARQLLIALARDSNEGSDHIKLSAYVRDKRRVILFHVELSLDLNWTA
ncbi:DUF6894 family protein [Methylobacterium planeticum]|uniref:DUF6894 domain-containing protein n=1 Tax=Methylobacterium planeticum TaxID=2615211 RepID=A0A6N6MSX3_9HYPH|nr:hypothetical protein [Methylobacterium planeticum]KAB1072730.1 hypothetical protein F6X51_14040 [Methylobacterium planeticum]